MRHLIVLAALTLCAAPAFAADAIPVTLKDHKFSPAVIKVKANAPSMIALTNMDPTAEEFDSPALKVEKVVAGKGKGNIRIRALAKGSYPFTGEYHAGTAKGVVVAE